MEQGTLSNMDHSHHCKLRRVCRDWGSLLHDRDGLQSFARWEWCFFHSKNYEANSALTELISHEQRSGGRWRRCPRRSVEGDGCDMQS